ncbi:DUF1778 domain-containing protein [Pantoea sp. DY-15]|jgi:uncharacterized protein (DUF1778 family)|uniref:type II toxin -antitoxin system TacA 1-like antitoxin n=2 Tax=unclassified Pantoea TaxID=2630326 RepID=UPI001C957A1B|nr:DUF1778 domain-containing protein [Pantoea sp. DY-5]MBY4888307.1 DUF1778 domain-containing protein [Pantoea sp. DY-15]
MSGKTNDKGMNNVPLESSCIVLTDESWNAVAKSLKQPPLPNARLQKAAELSRDETCWEFYRE